MNIWQQQHNKLLVYKCSLCYLQRNTWKALKCSCRKCNMTRTWGKCTWVLSLWKHENHACPSKCDTKNRIMMFLKYQPVQHLSMSQKSFEHLQALYRLLTLIKLFAFIRRPKVVCLEESGPNGTISFNFSKQYLKLALLQIYEINTAN